MANKIKVRCPQRACPPLHVLGSSSQSRKPTMWSMRGHRHSSYDWWKRRQWRLWERECQIKCSYFYHWNYTSFLWFVLMSITTWLLTNPECLALPTNWSRNSAASGKSFLHITTGNRADITSVAEAKSLSVPEKKLKVKLYNKNNLQPMHCLITVKLPNRTLAPSKRSLWG